jgi:hypothetical protein
VSQFDIIDCLNSSSSKQMQTMKEKS